MALALAAAGCLALAVLLSPPPPAPAILSAILGWLCAYALMVQRECRLLASTLEPAWPCAAEPDGAEPGGTAADVASGDPAKGTQEALLTTAPVSDYLRCAGKLRQYQQRNG